jgi:hypothetical protein
MANALDIFGSIMEVAGKMAFETQKKEELANKFEVAFSLLKKKYDKVYNDRSVIYRNYELYSKVMINKTMMEIEGKNIARMIPYRLSEDSAKEICRFFKKYDINVPIEENKQEIHIHIHF